VSDCHTTKLSRREQHFDTTGRERMKFGSHWRAKQYIEKRNLAGVESYWCEMCRTVHVGYPPRVVTNALTLPGL